MKAKSGLTRAVGGACGKLLLRRKYRTGDELEVIDVENPRRDERWSTGNATRHGQREGNPFTMGTGYRVRNSRAWLQLVEPRERDDATDGCNEPHAA